MMHVLNASIQPEPRLTDKTTSLGDDFAKQIHQHSHQVDNTPSESFTFPLLKLPAELRLHIWALAVTAPAPIRLSNNHLPSKSEDKHSALAIVHTCRQIYLETASLYYSLNIFIFHSLRFRCLSVSGLRRFTEAIGPENTKCLISVRWATTRAHHKLLLRAGRPRAASVFVVKSKQTTLVELNGEGVEYLSHSSLPKILALLALGKRL